MPFNIKKLTSLSGDSQSSIELLEAFGKQATEEAKRRADALLPFVNGEMLISPQAIDEIEKLVMEVRHIRKIVSEVAEYHGKSVSALKGVTIPAVEAEYQRLKVSLTTLSSVVEGQCDRLKVLAALP